MPDKRYWDGRTVHVTDMAEWGRDRRSVEIGLTPESAGKLANLLRLANVSAPLPLELHELMVALDYVLVGDPASITAHRRMGMGKGMTPDGGR